ncbi:hypothetical protein SUGI_1483900, partial [Cryptomeria japonica]
MASVDLVDSTVMVKESTDSRKSEFCVGLRKSIGDLKEVLLGREVSAVGVHCIGGGGKTTLALALSNDPQIKDYFKNNVIFINVSQSLNLKEILEIMWEKIIKKKRTEFQNVEDGYVQLQQHLLKESKPTLVILDDVWSNRADALSLFCFWAFGQTSIPSTMDSSLVKEVQEKCGGLPLALKVIGSSLHGQPHVAWEREKNNISKGETIFDYHKEGLLRCFQPSIDSLDDIVKECFLDLGLFPGNRKICVDALLDTWVNVRKLEWQDSFAILSMLARRNLLNLTSDRRNTKTLNYRNASKLYFSQHDVIQDLSLYLGSQDNVLHRKRLLMSSKDNGFPEKWKSFGDIAFDAQIVSIHTGPMDETQWHEMNFPK